LEQGAATYLAAAFDTSLQSKSRKLLQLYVCLSLVSDASEDGELLTLFRPTILQPEITWFHEKDDVERLWTLSEDIVGQKFKY
jgi:hypothetical protein